MSKHLMIAFYLAALSGAANASAPAEVSRPSGMERVAIKECIAATHAEGNLYTVDLVGGARVEISKTDEGRPSAIRIVHANGEESLVDAFDDLAAQDAAVDGAPEALPPKASGAPRTQAQRMLGHRLRSVLRNYCKRARADEAATLKPALREAADPSTDWLLWPDLLEARAFWLNEARWQVEDTFSFGMDDWSHDVADWIDDLKEKQKPLPACSAVRDDCRSTCDRVGAYAGGVVCGSLAAIAGALSAGIGVSVGVYCGGRVLLKIEECRFNCVVPGVPCN